ncbi:CAAX amino terminal protease family [Idiomarina sp. A28L]|uniref:hypothetical protein n=1 Tax=Idiomarina sp. A28L TaxID=1036674 RepID=UPI0002138674|nr:hypothetical protein [Idiomarina sp. A28L]EGN74772.1 CAAX amino terminal protease family [Idiomarina sp. A28L]
MNFLQKETRVSIYIIKASAFVILTSFSLIFLYSFFFELPDEGPSISLTGTDFFGVVVFAPFVETVLMILSLRVFLFISRRSTPACILNAFLWSAMHSMIFLLWGFFTLIPFFVFSMAYLTWRTKSKKMAFFVAFAIHALLNLSPFVVMWVDELN